uniref:Uncharacterized protein n=1 Tax=Branchiostoma floridae TaxID=7739 RepID=C3ZGS9_BRAFL|eukprot:XP_002592294.1 hypothetical protein BRAFLDRAFT_71034 [Branchiostoma floridae]
MADGTAGQPRPGSEGQTPPPDLEMEAQALQPGQVGEGGRQPVLHEQTGQLVPQASGQGNQAQQQAPPVNHGQLVTQITGQAYPIPQQAPPLQHGDHHYGQTGALVPQIPVQGYPIPQLTPQFPMQLYHPSQQSYGAPTAMIHPYQGFPMAPQPAGHYNVPPAGASISQPSSVLQTHVAESPAAIVGAGLVAGVATGATTLAAFYMGNKQQTEEAIRRVVERDGHVQVEGIEEGSLLVRVKFLTLAGYWVMRSLNERIHAGTDRTCLQMLLEDELQRIGWTGPIQVGLEGWWFAEEEGQEEDQEEAAGMEQEERWEWAVMGDKQSVPASVTTAGDSGLPEDVSSVAAMSISSAGEVEEGPLKWWRARLQKHKDSPSAQREIKAYRSWEEGEEILTSSGYSDVGGVKALVKGFMQRDMASPSFTSKLLYGQSWLNLNKDKLKQLTASQLQADPTDSTCLLLTALQLPDGDSRVQTLQQVVDAVLQHGSGDWLYQHLHHIYCYLGWAIWEASPKPKPTMMSKLFKRSDLPTTNLSALAKALSAMASSLMYKQDHLNTVYLTAELSEEVSETEAIRQLEHFLSLAPECDFYVPDAHYLLATLYGHQQDRQKMQIFMPGTPASAVYRDRVCSLCESVDREGPKESGMEPFFSLVCSQLHSWAVAGDSSSVRSK